MSNNKKEVLKIILKDANSPLFSLWKWNEQDYKKSIKFFIDEAEVDFKFTLENFYSGKNLPKIQMPLRGSFTFTINNPPQEFLAGLKNSNEINTQETAKKLYILYEKAFKKLVIYGRWIAKLPNVSEMTKNSFNEIFYQKKSRFGVSIFWHLNNERPRLFKFKKRKRLGINPLFKSKNLLTSKKWDKIRNFASTNEELSSELIELINIKAKVNWGDKRIPAIETAALMEVVIKNKMQVLLNSQGQSKKKIKDLNDKIGLSVLLNVVLPLALTKLEMKKYKKYIDALDSLRKVRNDIMHENILEEEIDLQKIKEGVNAAIKILLLLNAKIN
ncbi:MAG: hypothetical protein WCT37_03790 [Patescibacteria group bacterium]|jgi:hypothetical protein